MKLENMNMFQRPSAPVIETELVIVGAGVSGITLAEQLVDNGIDFWLLGSPFESQLAKAGELQDSSLPEGTIGLDHIEQRINSLKAKDINHRSSLCTSIELDQDHFLVKTKFQDFRSNRVVIASGAKQKALGFEGEDLYFRKGISDCTVCDFPLYRDRPVAVVGNHPYTIRAAKLMRKHTNSVALLWYKQTDAPQLDEIDVYNGVSDLIAEGDDILTTVKFSHEEGSHSLEISGLFVEGQPYPASDFLVDLNLEQKDGYVTINSEFQTSIDNMWAIGDVTGKTSSFDEAQDHGMSLANILLAQIKAP